VKVSGSRVKENVAPPPSAVKKMGWQRTFIPGGEVILPHGRLACTLEIFNISRLLKNLQTYIFVILGEAKNLVFSGS